MSKLTISEAAKLKGVAPSTLRRWEVEGKLIPERTQNGHRRYEMAALLGIKAELSYTIGYCRVSSHDQKDDLARQKQVTELFCAHSARLYGSRSHKNKKIVEELQEVAKKI